MKTIIAKTLLAVCALAVVAAPLAADAHPKKHRYLVCNTQSAVRRNSNNGTVIGAVGGGLLGNAIGHNTTGTLIGAGAGAVAGHEIAKNRAQKKRCHYVYR